MCKEQPNKFCRKYDNNLDAIAKYGDLFYKDKDTKEWAVNPLGEKRVQMDKEFAEHMIQKFKEDRKYAFVKEQLSWIGLEDTFDEANYIENVIPNEERNDIEIYLNDLYTTEPVMLNVKDRQELIEKINVLDGNNQNRLLKSIHTLNGKLIDMGSQFEIQKFATSRPINKKKNYDNAWRIEKRNTDDI